MILDEQLRLRDGGSGPRVTTTEAGLTTIARDATTGRAVVQIDKAPLKGIPILVNHDADTGTSTDKTATVTIEACDTVDGAYAEVAKFPAVVHGAAAANNLVRRIASQKKYLRSVITVAGSDGTISVDFGIFVATGLMEED